MFKKLASRRVQPIIEPPKPQPSAFDLFGGWQSPDEEFMPSKAEAYRQGMQAIAALYAQRREERANDTGDS